MDISQNKKEEVSDKGICIFGPHLQQEESTDLFAFAVAIFMTQHILSVATY